MKHLSITLCAAALAVAFAVPALAENIVFQQALTQNFRTLGYFSDNVINNPGASDTTYDNFSLANNTTLGSVQWNGDFVQGEAPVNGFTLTIYASDALDGGIPAIGLYQEQVAGLANQTFDGAIYQFDEDTYSAPINFQAAANTEYWMSIVANTQEQGDWSWHISVAGDSSAYQTGINVQQQQNVVPFDMAFTLFDNTVAPPTAATPEPSSLMLLGTGVMGLAGTLRKRMSTR